MTARFSPGDPVRVKDSWPEAQGRRVHIRTPHFVRGRAGVVERFLGAYPNPEELAFGKPGLPPAPLYQVRFDQKTLFPDGDGAAGDTLTADLYEHWLEPGR